MKKVIIFYASYGGGHLSAAKSIQNYLIENYSDVETEIIDCVEYINKILSKLTTGAYREMAKKLPALWGKIYSDSQSGVLGHISSRANKVMAIKLKNLIKEKNPDLIISTHPFGSQMVSYLKKKNKVHCTLATILTDFASHGQWLIGHEYSDYFFVSNNSMKEELINYGVLDTKIYVTGIPMSNRFFETFDRNKICEIFNLNPNKKNVLFFAGGEFGLGKQKTLEIFRSLLSNIGDYQVIAISGKNEKIKKDFEDCVYELGVTDKVKVLGFTDKVPELMSISNLVITKPGGLTTTESLASQLPLVIINPIPGQEEENAIFLEKHGVGIWIRKTDNPDLILQNLLNSEEKLQAMKENTKNLVKSYSTKSICDVLMEI